MKKMRTIILSRYGRGMIYKYIKHWLHSSNGKGHGTHSPFVFDFITKVLNDKAEYDEYKKVESLRAALLADQRILDVEDLGAGSSVSRSTRRSVSSIAKNAAKNKKFSQLLFRIAKYYKPSSIIELGTSLGISSGYLSLANPGAVMITMEGSAAIAAVAKENFRKLYIRNCRLIEGNFDNELQRVLDQLDSVGLAFIDGNHRKEPTLRYFDQLLDKTSPDTILIFDDIHWSREMEEAWDLIRLHPRVSTSIDLFFIGILIFRTEFREKQQFSIRF